MIFVLVKEHTDSVDWRDWATFAGAAIMSFATLTVWYYARNKND